MVLVAMLARIPVSVASTPTRIVSRMVTDGLGEGRVDIQVLSSPYKTVKCEIYEFYLDKRYGLLEIQEISLLILLGFELRLK